MNSMIRIGLDVWWWRGDGGDGGVFAKLNYNFNYNFNLSWD